MQRPVDIIYLSCCEKWWDWERNGFVSRPAQLARALASHPSVRRLLVVDTPSSVLRAAVPSAEDAAPRSGLTHVSDGVYVLDQVRLLPKERAWDVAYRLNGRLHERPLVKAIVHTIEELSLDDPVMWLSGPLVARTAAAFPNLTIVYDAMDEWLALPEMQPMRRHVLDSYEVISSRADLVFAVSRRLVERFSVRRPVAVLVPNAVDATRFASPRPMPADLAAVPEPRVGYVGMLQDRIDVDLIGRLARRLPNVSFVLVGPVLDEAHFARLAEADNVHLMGARSADLVPSYLAAFDACFLPHCDTELTRAMDPLKLYEYVAAGKPTVASDVAFEQPAELVRRATDDNEFVRGLEDAVFGRWVPDPHVRQRHLSASTWEKRVDEMLAHIAELPSRAGAKVVHA